jgi:GT2 family glycosyltransferase
MGRPRIVVLGMMTKIPVSGVVWQTLHYLVGFERLGYETYYVEAHARTPSMLMERADEDGSAKAAAFIAGALEPFGFRRRWAYHALHADQRCYGLSEFELSELYGSAALIINLHGGTEPRPEHVASDRLVYVETDPVDVQVQLAGGRKETIDYLNPHCAYFTFGENYGNPKCGLPISSDFRFLPTRQPVVLDFWRGRGDVPGDRFTTIASWRQQWRDIRYRGQTYTWSKHHEFLKFIDLPTKVAPRFELALAGYEEEDRQVLEAHGWLVREALSLSRAVDAYRSFIAGSRAEFTVAKDQNVRLLTGWFSDRSATYLAAGRPVITQDTGFGNKLPTGEGLFAFRTLDDIVAAVEAIETDYSHHSRAAGEIAREYFDAEVVLRSMLDRVGMPRVRPGLVLAIASRRPTTLQPATVDSVMKAGLPVSTTPRAEAPDTSVVVVTRNELVYTRLCLESVMASQGLESLEAIVVDNGSSDGTLDYLDRLATRDARLRVVCNGTNRGFAAAVNAGLRQALGRRLVILNNDTIVPPRSLARLLSTLDDPAIGLVGPVSNEAATEAEVEPAYSTYDDLLVAADERAKAHSGELVDVPMLTMFCIGMRRDVYESVGPLDEQFGIALFEDDDYSLRVKHAGYRVVCVDDVLIHHFGEASLGALVPIGEHARIFAMNRRRFENKWGHEWQPHGRRQTLEYGHTILEIKDLVLRTIPAGARVLVVSKGDEDLVKFDGRVGAHFPQVEGGVYAGHHPADGKEAIAGLERMRSTGAEFVLFPATSRWWLDYYGGLRAYLERGGTVADSQSCVIYRLEAGHR